MGLGPFFQILDPFVKNLVNFLTKYDKITMSAGGGRKPIQSNAPESLRDTKMNEYKKQIPIILTTLRFLMDIPLLDHIIIGDNRYTSFREQKFLI